MFMEASRDLRTVVSVLAALSVCFGFHGVLYVFEIIFLFSSRGSYFYTNGFISS